MTKLNLSAKGGIQSSFVNILIISATTCREPNHPTRFGPKRSCQNPSNLRSTVISKAAVTITTPNMRPTVSGEPISRFITSSSPPKDRSLSTHLNHSQKRRPQLYLTPMSEEASTDPAHCHQHKQQRYLFLFWFLYKR